MRKNVCIANGPRVVGKRMRDDEGRLSERGRKQSIHIRVYKVRNDRIAAVALRRTGGDLLIPLVRGYDRYRPAVSYSPPSCWAALG